MKSLFYIILLVLLPVISFSQNYNCLQPGVNRYFISGNNYLRGMRIDSVTVSNGDTIFHPYHTPRFALPDTTFQIGYYGLDSNGSSWLGKNVVKHADGTFIFDNEWSPGVTIKTQAAVGDSWTFFSDTTNISYTATLTAMDTTMVLGTVDSIRIITITAYSGGAPDPIDPVNNFQIKLSKDHGFVQVFDLYTFPYHRPGSVFYGPPYGHHFRRCFDYNLDITLGNLGTCDVMICTDNDPDTVNSIYHLVPFHNPSMTEVNNYGVGDIYYSTMEISLQNPPGVVDHRERYEDSVISVSGNVNTSTTYQALRHRNVYEMIIQGNNITYVNTYDTSITGGTFYGNMFVMDTTKMPEEWLNQKMYHYYPTNNTDTNNCYSAGTYEVSDQFICFYSSYTITNSFNTCCNIAFNSNDLFYKLGYGQDSTFIFDGNAGVTTMRWQSYVRKSGIDCLGFRWTEAVSTLSTANYKIYPNPATSTLQVDNDGTLKYSCSLYNMLGQKVVATENNASHAALNIASLANGIYLLTISDERGVQINRKIAVQH